MGWHRWVGACAAATALSFASPDEAEACGGCFHGQQSESTQVTGHRMILSLSQAQTTLYDQIAYAGEPESFAWVLPIKGQVTIGLSSDLLFNALDDWSAVVINSPPYSCGSSGFVASGVTTTSSSSG